MNWLKSWFWYFYFQESDKGLPELLDYASCLIHLAVFGILGVINMLILDCINILFGSVLVISPQLQNLKFCFVQLYQLQSTW